MAKVKSKYVCQNCGYETAGYLGKCPECNSWASFIEEIDTPISKAEVFITPEDAFTPLKLNEIEMNTGIRTWSR